MGGALGRNWLGLANISDAGYKLNNIDGVSLKSESSNEFYFNLIEKILPIHKNNLGITTGLGFDWHNYFLDNNTHLLEVNDVTDVYPAPAGVNYEYSRLRTFHITVPLMLEWQPTFGQNHKFFVTGGVVGGVNTFASYKVKYKDPQWKFSKTCRKQRPEYRTTEPQFLSVSWAMAIGAFMPNTLLSACSSRGKDLM